MHTGTPSPSLAVLCSLVAFSLAACGGDDGDDGPTPPGDMTGTVEASATTTGDDVDPDGYTVTLLDSGESDALAVNGSATFTDVDEGETDVELSGVADNCSVTGGTSRTVTVTAGETATVSFTVTCAATTGAVEVSATTTGDTLDADGYTVALDGGAEQSLAVDGTVTFDDVAPGEHELTLSGVQPNCSTASGTTTDVTVEAGEAIVTGFDLSCLPALFDRITFTTDRGMGGIYVMASDGSNETHVIGESSTVETAEISPDGTNIVLTGLQPTSTEIFVANVDGSGLEQLTDDAARDGFPTWSPDGTQIAFVSDRAPSGDPDIHVMDADGTNIVRITDDGNPKGAPAWSPDGSSIAFGRGTDGVGEIYVAASDGSGVSNLTNHAAADGDPAYSPDGSRIAFLSTRAAGSDPEIFVMDADGTNVERVTSVAGLDRWPAWTSDGSRIVYTTERSGFLDLRSIAPDGSGDVQLTPSTGDDLFPRGTPGR